MQKNIDAFKKYKTEVISVFREEKEGVAGLKKMRKATGAEFHIWDDTKGKSSKAYSQGGKFNTYVIDEEGVIRAVLEGTKTRRPPAAAVLKEVAKLVETSTN